MTLWSQNNRNEDTVGEKEWEKVHFCMCWMYFIYLYGHHTSILAQAVTIVQEAEAVRQNEESLLL